MRVPFPVGIKSKEFGKAVLRCFPEMYKGVKVMRNYPEVPRRVVTDTYFGVTVEDPYRYMDDKDAP